MDQVADPTVAEHPIPEEEDDGQPSMDPQTLGAFHQPSLEGKGLHCGYVALSAEETDTK